MNCLDPLSALPVCEDGSDRYGGLGVQKVAATAPRNIEASYTPEESEPG